MVGVRGFEPRASWTRTKRDTKLRHTPMDTVRYYSDFKRNCQAENYRLPSIGCRITIHIGQVKKKDEG